MCDRVLMCNNALFESRVENRELTVCRFLAIILPILTLATHLLLSVSFALPGHDGTWAFWSLSYNGLAACASVLGLIGALRVSNHLGTTDK